MPISDVKIHVDHGRINFKAAENGAICVFDPHPILNNVKTESVSGHFRLSTMTQTEDLSGSKTFLSITKEFESLPLLDFFCIAPPI